MSEEDGTSGLADQSYSHAVAGLLRAGWATQREIYDNRAPSGHEIEAKDKRGAVSVLALDAREWDVPVTLSEAIAWLQDIMAEIPESLRSSARLGVESVGGYEGEHHAEVSVTYQRPETDEEWSARKADVERRLTIAVRRQEAADRAEFERLQAKYAPHGGGAA